MFVSCFDYTISKKLFQEKSFLRSFIINYFVFERIDLVRILDIYKLKFT